MNIILVRDELKASTNMTKPSNDPALYLPDVCMHHILQFVGTKSFQPPRDKAEAQVDLATSLLSARSQMNLYDVIMDMENNKSKNKPNVPGILEAARFYYHFAQVNKVWSEVVQRFIQHAAFLVELKVAPEGLDPQMTAWVTRHRLHLGSIILPNLSVACPSAQLWQLLKECNTAYLTWACVDIWGEQGGDQDSSIALQNSFRDLLSVHGSNIKKLHLEVTFNTDGLLCGLDPFLLADSAFKRLKIDEI